MSDTLKIVSWNINSVRARIEIVEQFLREEEPDILCLQETKVRDDQFPEGMFRRLGYNHLVLNGQPMHHGVAMISKVPLHEQTRNDWQANGEARHIGGILNNGVRVENVYIPAGGEVADREVNPKFGQKLDFYERMTNWSKDLKTPTILLGDFNIAPLESDVWSHKQLLKIVSHTPIEVEHLAQAQDAGNWVDITRQDIPEGQLYSWWSYRAKDWSGADKGRRLDHIWATQDIANAGHSSRIRRDVRGWEQPSDHAPVFASFDL